MGVGEGSNNCCLGVGVILRYNCSAGGHQKWDFLGLRRGDGHSEESGGKLGGWLSFLGMHDLQAMFASGL